MLLLVVTLHIMEQICLNRKCLSHSSQIPPGFFKCCYFCFLDLRLVACYVEQLVHTIQNHFHMLNLTTNFKNI